MQRPTDKPDTKNWLVRTPKGDCTASSYPELLELKRSGKIGAGFFYHPIAQYWVRTQAIEELRVCKNCGHIGTWVEKHPFNVIILVILLICGIIPGIVYLVYCNSLHPVIYCHKCNSLNAMLPVTSPQAFSISKAPNQIETGFCASCGKYHQGKAIYCPHCGVVI